MPRTPHRRLRTSEPLRDALLLYRARYDLEDPPTLDAEQVAMVEDELGGKLPEDVLAYVAALGKDIRRIAALTDDARAGGLDHAYAAFARDELRYWVTPLSLRRRRVEAQVGAWTPGDDEVFIDRDLVRYLRVRFDLHRPTDEERAVMDARREDFMPSMSVPPPPMPRQVTHPKFGPGVVLQEIRDRNHKLVVEFAEGRRTVLASFVAPVAA